jgi:hypothetical protein
MGEFLIKKLNQVDEVTLPEIVFANNSLSDALIDVDSFNSVNRSIEDLFAHIRGTKTVAEKEKEALDKKKADELNVPIDSIADEWIENFSERFRQLLEM